MVVHLERKSDQTWVSLLQFCMVGLLWPTDPGLLCNFNLDNGSPSSLYVLMEPWESHNTIGPLCIPCPQHESFIHPP